MSDTPENMRGTRDTNTRANTDTPTSPANTNGSNTRSNQKTRPQPTSNPSTPPSLGQRIQNSATGLARSAFADSGAAQVLSGVTNEKTGSGSGSGSVANSAGATREAYGLGSGSSGGATGQRAGTSEAFRGENTAQEGGFSIPALSEEEFQRGEYGGFEDSALNAARSSGESLQAGSGNWKGKSRARDPVQGEFTTAWERANTKGTTGEGYTGTAEADGAAVVSLLSSASFDTDFGGELEDLDPDAAPPPLTAEEIKLLDSFRRQVAQEASGTALPSQTQSSPAHLSSLSLVPDIDTFLQQNDPSAYASPKIRTDRTGASLSLRDDVLAHLPGAEDWVGVHERYHDEVWGYLRPALEAAKTEMEERTEGMEHDEDGPAVRRLKMILKHMKA